MHGLWIVRLAAALALLAAALPLPSVYADTNSIEIRVWDIQWIPSDAPESPLPAEGGSWTAASSGDSPFVLPPGTKGLWMRISLPPTNDWKRPGLLIDRLFGMGLTVHDGKRELYVSNRNVKNDLNKLLVPLEPNANRTTLYIRMMTDREKAGPQTNLVIGEFESLSNRYIVKELPNLLLGASTVILSLLILLGCGFLQRGQRRPWIALSLIVGSIGSMVIIYSPLPYLYFPRAGFALWLLFDVSLFAIAAAFNEYVDRILEGRYRFFSAFRRLHLAIVLVCLAALAFNLVTEERYFRVYLFLQTKLFGLLMLVQLLLIIGLLAHASRKGNRNAAILSAGLILFAVSASTDLALYYFNGQAYAFFLWKFGVIALIVSLTVILARRVASDYTRLVAYTRELEMYNHTLQRTEKLKIISDLAASVAHEVRNPLQVTRGFLQLLAERTDTKSRAYYELATNELDRASEIITDFLTFAKPEMDVIHVLDVTSELRKIEAMMAPLAAMHGCILTLHAEGNLPVSGNASKLKQALINIVKNSIEAAGLEGAIEIRAAADDNEAVIRITDNGDGMEEHEVARLGEPFFSTKSRGTGLGLMVTFRIIEVMKGTIRFRSVKAQGTEVTIRFPLALEEKRLPGVLGQ